MEEDTEARRGSDTSQELKIVLGLISVAAVTVGVSFAGLILEAPSLRDFGIAGHPILPVTALTFGLLAAAFCATVKGNGAAPILLTLSLVIVVIALFESAIGVPSGIGRFLLSGPVAHASTGHPGRPAASSMVACGFIGLALLASRRRDYAYAELANLLASAALCFGILSIMLLLGTATTSRAGTQIFVAPLPGGVTAIALASAFLIWRHEGRWTMPLNVPGIRRAPMILLLPFVVILPVLPTLTSQWRHPAAPDITIDIELIAVLGNIAITGFLLWLAVDRLSQQRAALEELSAALDVSTIALTRPGGEITYWSRGCEQLYGWSAAEALGRHKHDLLQSRLASPESTDTPRPVPGGFSNQELVERRRDSAEISVLEQTKMLERPGREPLRVLKMLDISERVHAEEKLRLSEARLATAAEAYQLGVSQWHVQSDLLEWSPGSEQRLGLSTGCLSSFERWFEFVAPEDRQVIRESLEHAVANHDDRIGFKYRFCHPDGTTRTIEGNARCFYDADGALETVIAANIDVTEREENNAASQLQSIIETVPDATVVIDDSGKIRSFSAAAERMFDVDSASAIGRNVKFLMPDITAAGHDASIARYLITGERHVIGTTRELTARRADGSLFPIELNVGEAWLGEERIFTGVIRDVSDRLATEQRLRELSAELAHISRQSAMSELAADLAHELNQPLSATANFLAAARMLIERGEDGGQVGELLRMGEEQTLRSGEIIRRLRDFLVKREGEMRGESLEHVVREAVELVLFGTAQFEISLSYNLDPSADRIFADRIQVQQVLVNLLRNAVDALRHQPVERRNIIISSQCLEEGLIEIAVSDSGPGLPKAVSEQLYSRFATTKDGTAMGIGLSISRRIIEAHGGTLVAENLPEGGAAFRFTLPALEEIEE